MSSPTALVKAFVACVATKNLHSMHQLVHPQATACMIRHNTPQFKPLSEAIDALGNAEQPFTEAIWDEVEHVDGEYATVCAKFRIHRDGKVLTSIHVFPWKNV